MSSICGIYSCNGKPVMAKTGDAMMRALGIYQADAVGTWYKEQVFLGCHHRHVTPESVQEILPYHDELCGLAITADAIIDNREELFVHLGVLHSQRENITDSLLILQAYRKWGAACPEYLVGDFAFAIWDQEKQELFCAVDHTGTRAFYYYRSAGLFAFSTLIGPLFVLPEIIKKHNETWLADYLAMPCVMHQLDPELTPYKDIYLLPAGHLLRVNREGMEKRVYWTAKSEPAIKLKSDQEYEAAFREVLGEAVRCRLRSIRPVGVMMSGGLDSTTVACLASRDLAECGRRITAFTAVPMAGFRNWLPPGNLADESGYVEAVREKAGNLDVVYCRSEGRHPLSDTGRLMAVLEQPYKNFENLFWLDSILSEARERQIGVILNGSAGNRTISWGSLDPYLLRLLRTGKLRHFVSESWAATRGDQRRWRALLYLFVRMLPYEVQKQYYRRRDPGRFRNIQALSPINPGFDRRMRIDERFRRFHYDPLFINYGDSRSLRPGELQADFFSHVGQIITKHSLPYGVVQRDPTMDKRVIEFCLRVPDEQYVRNGQARLLLRRAMDGLLPDKVRLNRSEFGMQGVDWAQRLQPNWTELRAEIEDIGALPAEREYLDVPRIQAELDRAATLEDNGPANPALRMLVRSLIFSRWLRREENG